MLLPPRAIALFAQTRLLVATLALVACGTSRTGEFPDVDAAPGDVGLGDTPVDATVDAVDAAADTDAGTADTESDAVDFDAQRDPDAPADAEVDGSCDCDDGLYCNGVETCDAEGTCVAGVPPEPVDDGDPCTIPTVCNDDLGAFEFDLDETHPECVPLHSVPTTAVSDYAYAYWPGNHRPTETWPVAETEWHFLAGSYGLAFDHQLGSITHAGPIVDDVEYDAAALRDNTEIEAFPALPVRWSAGVEGSLALATDFLGAEDDAVHRSRMIDGGRAMNRLYVPTVSYESDASLSGEIQIASMPRHFVLTHTTTGSWDGGRAVSRISVDADAIAALGSPVPSEDDQIVEFIDDDGIGWLFAIYPHEGSATRLTLDASGALVAERTYESLSSGEPASVSLLVAPTHALGAAERTLYAAPTAAIDVHYQLLNADGESVDDEVRAEWDETLGAFRVTLGTLQDAGAPRRPDWEDEAFHNWYGRHRLRVETHTDEPLSLPLAFFSNDRIAWYITGGVALFRSVDGEPIGAPLQISKNWHEPGNPWYHLYSQSLFPSGESELELTVASSRWGRAYAASHAQLSLIGWNTAGGHWDESALGVFGESITYDPDVTLGRAMMDDVRPFLVQSVDRWNWTGNVGGADFLRYRTAAEPYWERRLSRVRSTYAAPGPNLTDVTYSGVSTDGRIQGVIRVQMGATDDLVRAWYQLEYTFLEDVEYDRLAFFQIAADRYADNGFQRYAYGNSDGVILEEETPYHRTTGYASNDDRGIRVDGEAPWVMLFENTRIDERLPEHYADIGFIVREFEALVGDAVLTTPTINVHRTNDGPPQMAFELGLPHEEGSEWCGEPCDGRTRFVPAGSVVRATVEYVVPPADRERYYGENAQLEALDDETFGTAEMMRWLAAGNAAGATVELGTARRGVPLEVDAAEGAVAALFEMPAGIGYRPVTVSGLVRHDGWVVERESDGVWAAYDQDVHGADSKQVTYDPEAEAYALTVVLPGDAFGRFRLRWAPEAAE